MALSIFPDPVTGRYKDASWQAVGEELKALLTPDEYASAKRTTFNAFYTSPTVIAAMHQALARLGLPAGATILEPGCGIGNFIGQGPQAMRYIGVEMDSLSGRIARLLHPGQDIRIENFRDSKLPENSIDAVIGNVPFADLKLDYRGRKLALHDFFFAKSVDALKPGGVLALVTSHFTLDKVNGGLREYLDERADFFGAVRLPADAFKREGTSVVTDIVFLRKRRPEEPAHHADPDWLAVAPLAIEGEEVAINRYFINHPDRVLGAWTRKDTLYGEGYSVAGNGDLSHRLQDAIGGLAPQALPGPVASSTAPRHAAPIPFTPPPALAHIGEGSFFVGPDRTLCQCLDGHTEPVVYGGVTLKADGTLTGRRLAALVALRDLARRVLQSQNEGWPEANRQEARRSLNTAYDRFVAAYGPINKTTFSETAGGVIRRMPNVVKFREDPDAMLVLSLEDYDEMTGQAAKAAIMMKDVVGKPSPVTAVTSAAQGLLVSLDQRGQVDLPFIARLYGRPEPQVIAELSDLIFHDPESTTWQTADAYLSGNVRAKLAAAERAGPAYGRNARLFAPCSPRICCPATSTLISARRGSRPATSRPLPPSFSTCRRPRSRSATWPKTPCGRLMPATTPKHRLPPPPSTARRANGTWLFELALNMKTPVIYDTVTTGDGEERSRQPGGDACRPRKANAHQGAVPLLALCRSRPYRTPGALLQRHLQQFRPRLFDGSHLDFPGMNQAIQLDPHQQNAVWRGMSSGNTLLAHAVGAGKTFTMAATGMKMKQAGLIKKPLYVGPQSSVVASSPRDFMQLYPNAQLLGRRARRI